MSSRVAAIPVSSSSSRVTLAVEIDPLAEDVLTVRRARGEIDRARVGGVRGHLAEQEGAVGALQRRHRKAVADGVAGEAEIAPGEESGEIGLEIGAAQHELAVGARLERVPTQQQHAAVEQARLRLRRSSQCAADFARPLAANGQS